MKILSGFFFLSIFFSSASIAQTPFDEYASDSQSRPMLMLPEAKFKVYNPDTTNSIRHVELDKKTGLITYYDKKDSLLGSFTLAEGEEKWQSTDLLAKKYPGNSPYSFCSNNPTNRVDMDGRDDFTFHNLTYITSYKVGGEYKTQTHIFTSVDIVRNNLPNTYSVHNVVATEDLTNKTNTFSEQTKSLINGNDGVAGKLLSENWGAVSSQYADQSMPIGGSSFQTPGYPGAANLKGSCEFDKKENDNNINALSIMLSAIPIGEFFEMSAGAKAAAGGRLGNAATRNQIGEIATDLRSRGYTITGGGGRLPEEYLSPIGGGRKGGSYIDITAEHPDYGTLRINTVDVNTRGIPTTRELNNASRIRQQIDPGEHLLLTPKIKD